MKTTFIDTAPLLFMFRKICDLRDKLARIFSMCALPPSRFMGGASLICHPGLIFVDFMFCSLINLCLPPRFSASNSHVRYNRYDVNHPF